MVLHPRLAIMLTTDISKCKLCGCPVRIIRRADGAADHYEALEFDDLQERTTAIPPALDSYLRRMRRNEKTVAIVGSAWTTRAWAPYGEDGVEVWCFNEMHGQSGVGRPTRWFQLHPKWSFTKDHRLKHWAWLQERHGFPIYMQRKYDDVPNSVAYPLREIQDRFLQRLVRGEEQIKRIFGSTMAYAIALALHEDFSRIELFGIELTLRGEWAYQRESMAFWLGKADGMGVDVWMPEQCELFKMPLYAYDEVRRGDGGILMPPENAE